MSTVRTHGPAIALSAIVLGIGAAAGTAAAGPLTSAKGAAVTEAQHATVHDVRHRRRGGVGIFIGPDYDYDYGYGYGYGPRYGYYYDDGYYDYDYRPRRYSRRWVRERFEHPLGRR
jgi:hypothetical protein